MVIIRHLIFFSLLLLAGLMQAQAGGALKGKITDGNYNNEPVAFADVAIYKETGQEWDELVDGASADVDGNYYLPNIPAGSYIVEITYIDFPRAVKIHNLLIVPNKTTQLDYKYPKYDNSWEESRLGPIYVYVYHSYPTTNNTDEQKQGEFSVSTKILHR